MKLTFKEYLDSKNKLLEAITKSPVQRSVYDISWYCKLAVLKDENDESKITLLLKPKQQVIVEWKYENINDPIPVHIRINDEKNPELYEVEYYTNWKGIKLKDWLSKNTTEHID